MQKYIIYFIIRRVIKFFKNNLYPNTQQQLKAPAKSSLFSPNSCITQIKVVPLNRQSSPSLLTMLKSCEAFFIYGTSYGAPDDEDWDCRKKKRWAN